MNHNLSYAILNNLRVTALEITKQKSITKTEVNSIEYYKTNTSLNTKSLIQSTVTISREILKEGFLNNAEKVLALSIGYEIKYCNNLWAVPPDLYDNKTSYTALRSLVQKHILYATETRRIFIVNPYYIRYGEFYEVLFSTMELCKEKLTVDKVTRINPIREQTKFS